MEDDDLFINIQRYRPRENTNPKENFFTEILAFILNEDEKLRLKFINSLKLPKTFRSAKSIKVKTQEQYFTENSNTQRIIRPDIEITDGNSISIFIEVKVDSSVRETEEKGKDGVNVNNQLLNYLKFQEKRRDLESYVILLCHHNEDLNEEVKNHPLFIKTIIFWEDIYTLFKDFKSEYSHVEFLKKQFEKFMEDENMKPYNKITENMVKDYEKFVRNIENLFDKTMVELKKENSQKINDTRLGFGLNPNFGILYGFRFNGRKFELNLSDSEFALGVLSKGLDKKYKNEIKKLGFEKRWGNNWLYISKRVDNFKSDKQLEDIINFFIKQFNLVKEIL